MKNKMKIRNFIIFFLLAVLVISSGGSNMEHAGHVSFARKDVETQKVSVQTFISCDNFSEVRVFEKTETVINLTNRRYSRSDFSYRNGLFFLCTLTYLSGISKLDWEFLNLYNPCHIKREYYNITFMHDMDGRKRIS